MFREAVLVEGTLFLRSFKFVAEAGVVVLALLVGTAIGHIIMMGPCWPVLLGKEMRFPAKSLLKSTKLCVGKPKTPTGLGTAF